MAYLRTKKISSKYYCYLVENKHTQQGPRQKVKKYLGRTIPLQKKKDLNFFEFYRITNPDQYFKNEKKQLLNDLIKFELISHDFKEKNNFLINQDLSFNLKNFQTKKNNKPVILSLNQGFLCPFTIRRILRFNKSGDFQKDALKLAKYFIEAGLNIPQEVFIEFYKKRK